MPARSSSKASTSTSAAAASKPRRFDFKQVKRTQPSSGTSSGSKKHSRTTTSVHEAVIQSGDREGEKSGRRYFVFNPRYGLNDKAKALLEPHVKKGNTIKSFNKELGGFPVVVHSPVKAQDMHKALRDELEHGEADLPDAVDVGDWAGPLVTIVTLYNVDVKTSTEEYDGVTALMLEGESVYPIKDSLKCDVKYEFVRGLHGKEGVNKWVRVVGAREKTADLVKATAKVLTDHGWQCETAEADAANWDDDE